MDALTRLNKVFHTNPFNSTPLSEGTYTSNVNKYLVNNNLKVVREFMSDYYAGTYLVTNGKHQFCLKQPFYPDKAYQEFWYHKTLERNIGYPSLRVLDFNRSTSSLLYPDNDEIRVDKSLSTLFYIARTLERSRIPCIVSHNPPAHSLQEEIEIDCRLRNAPMEVMDLALALADTQDSRYIIHGNVNWSNIAWVDNDPKFINPRVVQADPEYDVALMIRNLLLDCSDSRVMHVLDKAIIECSNNCDPKMVMHYLTLLCLIRPKGITPDVRATLWLNSYEHFRSLSPVNSEVIKNKLGL